MGQCWEYIIILTDKVDDYTDVSTTYLPGDDDKGAMEYAKRTFGIGLGHEPERYRAELVRKTRLSA